MSAPMFHVDAFTDKPFAGNPAAVCLLTGPADAGWMQHVARDMNLSETAFLYPLDEGYSLRWFTPTVEVDLCGHATLASAHVLWEQRRLKPDAIARFQSRSGPLTAKRAGDWIELDFPSRPAEPTTIPVDLDTVVGASPRFVGRNGIDYLVELASEDTVRKLKPNLELMAKLPVRGVIVTAAARTPGCDFVSRFFAPGSGIAEDPVTGSAHCCLGPFWQTRLGKSEMIGHQVSARSGIVRVRMAGDRVLLGGQAVIVARGELVV